MQSAAHILPRPAAKEGTPETQALRTRSMTLIACKRGGELRCEAAARDKMHHHGEHMVARTGQAVASRRTGWARVALVVRTMRARQWVTTCELRRRE